MQDALLRALKNFRVLFATSQYAPASACRNASESKEGLEDCLQSDLRRWGNRSGSGPLGSSEPCYEHIPLGAFIRQKPGKLRRLVDGAVGC